MKAFSIKKNSTSKTKSHSYMCNCNCGSGSTRPKCQNPETIKPNKKIRKIYTS
jgi:hypothetical protein